jgi:hypothetical protein
LQTDADIKTTFRLWESVNLSTTITTNTLATTGTIDREDTKLQRIKHAVTLQSCKYNRQERYLRIKFLKNIHDDGVLDYVLSTYVEPYTEYVSGRTPQIKKTAINTREFLHKIGGIHDNPTLDFFGKFYFPMESEEVA